MKTLICLASFAVLSAPVWAQELTPADLDREPAAINLGAKKRTYPGGSDEEDLRVQAALPEAAMKTDSRSLQREVYKQLYNQELKDERHDEVEE